MDIIWEQIITKEMAGLAAASVAIMLFMGRIPYKGSRLNRSKIWKDWGEFILVTVCLAGSFAPGVHGIPYKEWGGILVFALVTSMVALLGRKVLKPIIIKRLEGKC